MGAEEVKSEAAVRANGDALETSRRDARVLLWFATRFGKNVGATVLDSIVTAESDLRDNRLSSGNESKFWTAYRDLAAAVKPASVESILSTCEHPFREHDQARKWKLGNARTTKSWYTWFAVVVLIILLLLQTYWFVVTTFSASLEKHRDELDNIAGALRVMNVLAEEMSQGPEILNLEQVQETQEIPDNSQADSQQRQLPNTEQEGVHRFENPQLLDLIKNTIQSSLANNPMLAGLVLTRGPRLQLISYGSLDLENKKYRTQRLMAMIQNEKTVLQAPWKVLWYLALAPSGQATLPSGDRTGHAQSGVEDVGTNFQTDLGNERVKIEKVIADEELEQILSQSNSIPRILSQYILPMLYGLLGSLTYILRTLAMEIHEVTFTSTSAERYSLRWPLGMLAGVTVSLFFDPTSFVGLAAITSLAIAFLAGYGVELFFTALDGLVRTFTRDGPERPKAEAT